MVLEEDKREIDRLRRIIIIFTEDVDEINSFIYVGYY